MGLSFALLRVNIILASLTIGLVALGVTAVGFLVGRKASELIGKRAELVGGLVLIGIGVRIIVTHLLGG